MMKKTGTKLRKVLLGVSGVALAVLLLLGGTLGAFAQAEEIASSVAAQSAAPLPESMEETTPGEEILAEQESLTEEPVAEEPPATDDTDVEGEPAEGGEPADVQATAELIAPLSATSPEGDSLTVSIAPDGATDYVDVDTLADGLVNWSVTDTSVQNKTKTLKINAEFAGPGTEKTRTLSVNIPDGYIITSFTAKSDSDMHGLINSGMVSEMEAVTSSVELTAPDGTSAYTGRGTAASYQNATGNYTNVPYSLKGGQITYTFNSGAQNVEIYITLLPDSLLYNMQSDAKVVNGLTAADVAAATNGVPQAFPPVVVSMVSGAETLESSFKAQISVKNSPTLRVSRLSNKVVPTDTGYTTTNEAGTVIFFWYSPSSQNFLANEIVLRIPYPEGVKFVDALPYSTSNRYTNTIVNDEVNRVVTITYQNLCTMYSLGVYPQFQLSEDFYMDANELAAAIAGDTGEQYVVRDGVVTDELKKSTATFVKPEMFVKSYGSTQYIYLLGSDEFTITVERPEVKLNISTHTDPRYDWYAAGQTEYIGQLGEVLLGNDGMADSGPQVLKTEFSDGIEVYSYRLPALSGADVTDITVVTNRRTLTKADTSHLADRTVTGADRTPANTLISGASFLQEGEYILSVEAAVSIYKANGASYTNNDAHTNHSGIFYGKIVNGTGGTATSTLTDIASGAVVSGVVTVQATATLNAYMRGATTINKSVLNPGQRLTVQNNADVMGIYGSSVAHAGHRTSNAIFNPTLMLREVEGYSIDVTSVKLSYDEAGTQTIPTPAYTYNNGVYYFAVNDDGAGNPVVINYERNGYIDHNRLYVTYDLVVDVTNPGTSVNQNLSDFVAWDVAPVAAIAYGESGVVNDVHNMAGKGTDYRIVTSTAASFSVVPLKELKVTLGIRTKNSGSSYFYYNGTAGSIAPIQPPETGKNAEVSLTYENTSDSAYEEADIYFAIPKQGYTWAHYFNNKELQAGVETEDNVPFEWTAHLAGAVTMEGFTTHYLLGDGTFAGNASTYAASGNDVNWLPVSGTWTLSPTAAQLKDVVMVKFVRNAGNSIAKGASGNITFELEMNTAAANGDINYWRALSMARVDSSDGARVWGQSSVLAAEVVAGRLQGQAFADTLLDGLYKTADGDAAYTDASKLEFMLTEDSGAMVPMALALQADGSFKPLNEDDSDMLLKVGNYTLSVTNKDTANLHFSVQGTSTAVTNGADGTATVTQWASDVTGSTSAASLTYKFSLPNNGSNYKFVGIGLNVGKTPGFTFADNTASTEAETAGATISGGPESLFTGEPVGSEPTVTAPEGHTFGEWEIWVDGELVDTVAPGDLASYVVPAGDVEIKAAFAEIDFTADGFTISKDDLAALTDEEYIEKAGATATKTVGDGPATSLDIAVDSDAVEEAAGTYPVEYTAGGRTITVPVTVTDADHVTADNTKQEAIQANDFGLDSDEVAGLTPDDYIAKAGASAWSWNDEFVNTPITDISVNSDAVLETAGTYPVIFSTPDGTSVTVYVTVTDGDNGTVDPEKKEAIQADDLALTAEELADMDDSKYYDAAGVEAWTWDDEGNTTPIPKEDIAVDSTAVEEAPGTYPVSFTTPNGTTVTSAVTITDGDNATVDTDKQEAIQANNFEVKSDEVAGLTPADYIAKAEATAWSWNDEFVNTPITDISVNSDAVLETPGTYPVIFTTPNGTSVTVFVVVTDASDVTVDPEKQEAIEANDFGLTADEVAGLTPDDYIAKADAKAWSWDDEFVNTPITDISVNSDAVEETAGTYPVIFTTPEGTSVTVYATVTDGDNGTVNPDKKEAIQADDLTLTPEELADMDDSKYYDAAGVEAWTWDENGNTTPIPKEDIVVDSTAVEEAPGTYPVTFTTPNGTTVTSYVTVQTGDAITVDPENGEAIQASNFTVKVYQVEGLDMAAYIANAYATAWVTDGTNTPVEITAVDFSLVKAEAGSYPVTFSTAAGTSVSIMVTVVDNTLTLVTFNGNGADVQAAPASITLEEPTNTVGTLPTAPSRVGYTFAGWNTAADGSGSAFAADTVVSEDLVVYAQWSVNSYTLSFDGQGGSPVPASQTLAYGALASQPAAPAKQGYSFLGWYTLPQGGTQWNFATRTMPAADTTLYAQYQTNQYVVTYNYSGAGPDAYATVDYGTAVPQPSTPEWAGYAFKGWFTADGTQWDFANGTMPASDITLTARWEQLMFTVTYLTYDGGTVVATYQVYAGQLVPYIDGPAVAGHHFMAWALAEDIGICWNFYTPMPARDLVLLALYDKNAPVEPPASSTNANRPPVVAPSSKPGTGAASSTSSVASSSAAASSSSAVSASSSAPASSSAVPASSSLPTVIAPGEPPTATIDGWPLLNLLIAIAAAILAVVLLVGLVGKRNNKLWRVLGLLVGVATVIVTLLTSRFFQGVMVLTNRWTILLFIMLVVQIVLLIVALAKRKQEEEEEEVEE
ncbi:InlB B-repeat-containing protein [Ruminococcaceae bacterium OttesenSCG-928-A16]|nr:InlB B-repeat-containing protein [Ruminococcaceae bacterium OttesenSCG-928-A16]